jgi:hypothetical protein
MTYSQFQVLSTGCEHTISKQIQDLQNLNIRSKDVRLNVY